MGYDKDSLGKDGAYRTAEGLPPVQAEPYGGTASVREHIHQKAGAPAGSEQ